jgi:hypothetical protein
VRAATKEAKNLSKMANAAAAVASRCACGEKMFRLSLYLTWLCACISYWRLPLVSEFPEKEAL